MADKPNDKQSGLQHVRSGGTLSVGSNRSSLIARGRRDAASTQSNPHYSRAVTDYNSGDFAAAAENFRLAAEEGHAESQYVLGTLYAQGKGVPQDDAEAARWEMRAAEQGHAYAQANVSFRFYSKNDFVQAFAWCQRAAYSKLAWAQYNLGLMYRKGEGVEANDTEAAHWYRLAALQNFADAQQKLDALYYFGTGVPRDYAQAAAWFRRAADNGNAEAQFQLGHLYATGQGVEHDYTQSRMWIRKAAEQGHAEAQAELKRRSYRDPD